MKDILTTLSRDELANLGREYLLAGHLMDRAGMPHVIFEFGRDAMRDVAIEEWMGASPVYTRRMRRALRFEGDDVATIFKGMQFDIGAPHQFMDFRFVVHDAQHGEFSLASCGALMDVEPLGTEFVVTMCHHIEDPTFDATAAATNPRARMRPVHRPPRIPEGRLPHCQWTVHIDPDAESLPEPDAARRLAPSRAANIVLPPAALEDDEGLRDYSGPFDPDLQLEMFCRGTLLRILDEICLQGHLLARSFMLALARRFGPNAALRIGAHQLSGIAGLTATRLARLAGSSGGIEDIARVLALHPALRPHAYAAFRIRDEPELELAIVACDALAEGDDFTWPALLVRHGSDALNAIVQAVDPRATCTRIDSTDPVSAAWSIRFDPNAPPAGTDRDVALASFSSGAEFQFADRRR